MNHFDFRSHVDQVYATFPEAHHRPLIGLTANHSDLDATLRDRYYKQIVAAGGTPVIIPPVANKEVIVNTLEQLDGLILTGGADYNPLWMGEEPSTHLHGINRERDLAELLTARLAFNRQIPTLGICRGIQTLAIALGGKVAQDIQEAASPGTVIIKHAQDADRSEPTHSVRIADGSILSGIYEGETIHVNSFHHQAVAQPGPHFRITATAPDGTVEAIESTEHKAVMGVQWHPEWLEEEGRRLFKWLVDCAGNFHVAKELHKRVLTLDTHCDTPMFFPQGVQFDRRDPRILVDLHKMTEGRQDAVTMVAYLPQPKIGETFSSKIDLKGIRDHNPELLARYPGLGEETPRITPTQYADLIFDKIESIVRNGRKSIMLGIENGLAIERELANLKHFAQRGVVYITLCHNGDNDICDSARGCNTHDGVSSFGEKVIREMNDLGIMVDLSHGGEKSFYDALDISRVPIVCSHSNCKALCDVPRNLTDDQLRALAAKGGVAHTTLYGGFLRKDGEASVLDAVDHLEHAIRIMGIDHVGIGTDFDGDGGVRGMADSSELINFTIRLLRRKYSERDIEKIWGGNWLRVMAQVQNNRKA